MDRDVFVAQLRAHLFGPKMSRSQIDGCFTTLDAFDHYTPHADPRFAAYALATKYREAGSGMQPVAEFGHGKGRPYGRPAGPFVQTYYGRGDVQLTWFANYQKADAKLHAIGLLGAAESLVRTPDLALRPDIAAAIQVLGMTEGWFSGRKFADYFSGTRADWIDARAIINGHDHAALVASYALVFYHALQAAHFSQAA